MNSNHSVQSVAKAMKLLELLSGGPMSLSAVSAASGWPKSTVHALLNTMRDWRVVEQSDVDGRYRLGRRRFELGAEVPRQWDVAGVAGAHLKRLADDIGEPVYLAVLDGDEAMVIEVADSGSHLRISADKGVRLPAYCTAAGKALLATLPEAVALSCLPKQASAYTPHTITDPARFLAELESARQSGIAVEDGEYRIGLRAAAAAVFDHEGRAVCSLCVAGMFRRASDSVFIAAQKLVAEGARRISAELGYRPR